MFSWLGVLLVLTAQLPLPVHSEIQSSRTDASQRIATLRSTIDEKPISPTAGIELARLLTQSTQTREEAVERLEMLARQAGLSNNHRAVILYDLAYCHEQLGQEVSALERLVELATLEVQHPLKVKAILRLASLYNEKRLDQVVASWLSRVVRSDISSQDYPNYALLMARNLIDCGRAHRASEILQSLECYELAKDQRTSADFLSIQAAMELRNYEQVESSIYTLSELAKSEGSQPDWSVTLALRRIELALVRTQHTLAAELASQALQQFPLFERKYEFLYLLSRAEIALAQFAEARAHLQIVVESPQAVGTEAAAKAQWMIGETYFLQQSFNQAIHAYQLVLDEYQHPLWKSMAALQRAKCFEKIGRIPEAIDLYEATKSQFAGSLAADEAAMRLAELSSLELKKR